MDNNKTSKIDLITDFIGEITLYTTEIEHKINDLICEYFITSGKKKITFKRWLLYRGGFKFEDKIECLRFISSFIQDKETKGIFEMIIMFAMRFDHVKNKLVYGGICHGEESENVAIKTVNDGFYRYEQIEITPEYIEIMRDTATSTIQSLKNAMKMLSGAEQAT